MGALSHRFRRLARRVDPVHRAAPGILIYHRVATPPYDPWGMCLSPARFREQLAALKATRTFISLSDLVAGLDVGDLPRAATAVTFDDGYADNADAAKPILEELGVPATIFLTTGFIGSATGFWWDELAALVLAGRDAAAFDFTVAGARLQAQWPRQDRLPADLAAWRYTDEPSDARRSAYIGLWQTLQQLDAASRDTAMAKLRSRLKGDAASAGAAGDGPLSRRAAEALVSPLISIGGHGRTHVPLTGLPPAAREEEIARGRDEAAALNGGRPPDGFAYPHGSWDGETRAMVERAGYCWAVGSRSAKVARKTFDRFALPRVEPGTRSGAELLRSLRGVGF